MHYLYLYLYQVAHLEDRQLLSVQNAVELLVLIVNQSGDYKLKHCIFLRCAVVPKMATTSLQHVAFRLPFFLFFLVLRFFWIFVLISASGSEGQLKQVNGITACSAMGCRNMITFASKGRRRSGSYVTQVPKRKKDSPTPFLHSTSVPR